MIPSGQVRGTQKWSKGFLKHRQSNPSTNLQMMPALPRLLALKAVALSRVPMATFAVIN